MLHNEKNCKVEQENRKKRGEVFTPPHLAEEMINTLPELKIDAKFLDPCSGATCVFPA
jgi:type I restriction-modification system DNA methylase subunit